MLKDKLKKFKASALALTAMMAVAAIPGTVGAAPIDFTNTGTLNVPVTDVVKTGFSFMGLFDEYTMLVLGVIFAPVAIGFVLWLWKKLPKMGSGKA